MSNEMNEKVLAQAERELYLLDRLIGLEAENAQLKIESEIRDIRILHDSRAWRLGMIFLRPAMFLRNLTKRLKN